MRYWPEARAALVTLAIVVGLIDGCPTPPANPKAFLRPAERASLETWARRLGTTPEGLADGLARAGKILSAARWYALTPFRPLGNATVIRQRWRLFPSADPNPWRMEIEARRGPRDAWELVYRPYDREHAFLADEIEYRRLRGAWDPSTHGARRGYGPFVTWVAGRVFARWPEYQEVRVRMERLRVLPGGRGVEGTGEFGHEVRRARTKGAP